MDIGSTDQIVMYAAVGAMAAGVGVLVTVLVRGKQAAPADPEQARLVADMRELSDRMARELDAKSARLEKLLAEADRRAAAMAAREVKPVVEARTESAVRAVVEEGSRVEPMHASVHVLADQGLTPVQIAERTGVPTGQVELILALRRAGAGKR